jgi:hypothetical protein
MPMLNQGKKKKKKFIKKCIKLQEKILSSCANYCYLISLMKNIRIKRGNDEQLYNNC